MKDLRSTIEEALEVNPRAHNAINAISVTGKRSRSGTEAFAKRGGDGVATNATKGTDRYQWPLAGFVGTSF